MRTFKIYSLSNFQICNTLIIVTVLFITYPITNLSYNRKFVPVDLLHPLHLPCNPSLWQQPVCSLLLLIWFVLSHVRLFVPLWSVAHQAPLSMGYSRQEYWSGLPFPPLGYLPDPGMEPLSPMSPALQADSLPVRLPGSSLAWFGLFIYSVF